MADYWKSQPRKFCQYCKCWIADNKPSVEFHERGKNHKENVAAKIAEIKKKSLDKAKQEDRMSKEFAAMEDAAMKAYKEDLKRMQMESGESVAEDPPEPQPKPQPQQPPKQEKPHKKASHGKPGKQGKPGKMGKPGKSNLWMEGKSEDGHTYYYNTETGESLWEKPEGFQGDISTASHHVGQKEGTSVSAWMEAVSPEGYTYYFNSETGESSWERPADLPPLEEPSAPGTEPMPGVEERALGVQVQAEASAPSEGAGEANQQSNVPKISFRKRKAEPLEHEAEGEADRREGGGAEGGGGKGEVKEEKENTSSAPPVPNEATGKEEKPEAGSKEQQQQKDENKDRVQERPARRPRRTTPYGSWEQIKPEKDPYASVDLQLPQMEEDDATAADAPELVLPPEPKHKFTERTITSLGELGGLGGPAAFRKSKTHNGKARSLRQRAADD